MLNLSKVYKAVNRFFNIAVTDQGSLTNDHVLVNFPMVVSGDDVYPFTSDMLEAVGSKSFNDDLLEDKVYFFPFSEDHVQGKSPIYSSLELTTRVKANVKAWLVFDVFLELAVNPKRHKKAPPIAKKMLATLGKVDTKTYELFQKMRNNTDLMSKGLILSTSVLYHHQLGDKSYERVATLRSDFRADLVDGEKKVLGVTVSRKMDREALINLFDIVFPAFGDNKVQFPITTRNAPNLQSLVTIGTYVDELFSELGNSYAKLFDEVSLNTLVDTELLDLNDIEEVAVLSRGLNIPHNTGVPKAGTQNRVAAVSRDSNKVAEVKQSNTTQSTSTPNRQAKEKGKDMKTNTQRYLAAIGGNRQNPKSVRSTNAQPNRGNRNQQDGRVWVSNPSYDAGGYWEEGGNSGRNNGGAARGSLAERMRGGTQGSRFGGRGNTAGGRGNRPSSRGNSRAPARGTRGGGRQNNQEQPWCTLRLDGQDWDIFETDIRGTGDDAYVNIRGEEIFLIDVGVDAPVSRGRGNTNSRTSARGGRTRSRNNSPVLTLQDGNDYIDFFDEDVQTDNNGDYIEYNGQTYDV